MAAALLLAAALACFLAHLRGVAWMVPPRWRTTRYRRMLARSWALFALPSLVGLALLGRPDALTVLPPEFDPARRAAVAWLGEPDLLALLPHAVAGLLIGGLLAAWASRRGRRVWRVGDVSAVLPRTPRELAGAVAVSVSAGVTEELFFRLLLPLLIALVTGHALPAFAAALALFGLAHRYQGAAGVIATMLVGVILTLVYLLTANLAAAMALHAAIDLNALVVRPLIEGRVRRVSS